MRFKQTVDPELAKQIEEDMADIDKKDTPKTTAKTEKLVDCECVTTGWKPGLIDANTHCPKCNGTAKVAEA